MEKTVPPPLWPVVSITACYPVFVSRVDPISLVAAIKEHHYATPPALDIIRY